MNELKTLYNYDRGQDMMLFNNNEILVGGKPIFISEWLNSNILFTQDLLNSNGQFMSYQERNNCNDKQRYTTQRKQISSVRVAH